MKKLRVGILFGGRSGEHEVSLLSAASVFNAIDKSKFEVVPIGGSSSLSGCQVCLSAHIHVIETAKLATNGICPNSMGEGANARAGQ